MSAKVEFERLNVDSHMARMVYGDLPGLGLRSALPDGTRAQLGKAVLAIVGADGAVSDRERATFIGMARAFGIPKEVQDDVLRFDPATAKLEALVDATLRPMARSILHDAIVIARSDGFGDRERASAERAAARLGLDASIVAVIEGILGSEDAVRRARHRLLNAKLPDTPSAQPGAPHFDDEGWASRDQYGLERPAPADLSRRLGFAILAIAGADGEITEREWAWFLGQVRALGAKAEDLAAFTSFDYRRARVEDYLDASTRPLARLVLYDAIRMARADGFAEPERAAAARAAERLNVDPSIVGAIEGLVTLEDAVRAARVRALTPK